MSEDSVPRPRPSGSTSPHVARLMERLVASSSIDEQRAFYDTLSPEDQKAMDERGLQRMWRSRRAREAHQRRTQRQRAEHEQFMLLPADERRRVSATQKNAIWQEASTKARALLRERSPFMRPPADDEQERPAVTVRSRNPPASPHPAGAQPGQRTPLR